MDDAKQQEPEQRIQEESQDACGQGGVNEEEEKGDFGVRFVNNLKNICEREGTLPNGCPVSTEEFLHKHPFTSPKPATFTVAELVTMELRNDGRFNQLRRRELPTTFWNLRRWVRNKMRGERERVAKRKRQIAMTAEREKQFEGMSEEEIREIREQEYQSAVAAHEKQKQAIEEGYLNGLPIAVECGFSEKSNAREVRSLAKQLQYAVAANKRAQKPAQLHFTSFKGELKDFAVEKMRADRWKVHLSEESVLEKFPVEKMCVLSPDASQVLEGVDMDKIYVIGGLVDRSIQKNTTKIFAHDNGIESRRLPLRELYGSKLILNVNHVVDVLLRGLAGESLEAAIDAVLPKRKKDIL